MRAGALKAAALAILPMCDKDFVLPQVVVDDTDEGEWNDPYEWDGDREDDTVMDATKVFTLEELEKVRERAWEGVAAQSMNLTFGRALAALGDAADRLHAMMVRQDAGK